MNNTEMTLTRLTSAYDAPLAAIIRSSLKEHHLDIPGTVYYDAGLDHLSDYYTSSPKRSYFILLEGEALVGGIGLDEIDIFPDCCELQKLYLADSVRGRGLGYFLINKIEEEARRLRFRRIYLATHTNLQAAIHIYEKSGYMEIERPESVVHSTMNRFYLKELR